jgi:hypothetical protein
MLTYIEELGIKLLVLLRNGKLEGYKCSGCTDEVKLSRNCSGDVSKDVPVFYNEILKVQSNVCPIRLIPRSVMTFADKYDYYEKYPSSAPSYEEVNSRYWDSVKLYESFTSEILNSKDKAPGSDDDKLSKLRALKLRRSDE